MSPPTEPAATPVAPLMRITRDPEAFTRLGTAHARHRTLAAGILPCARSMLTSLRHPWLRSSTTPAPGHGQPLAALPRSTGFQPVCLPGSHRVRMRFRKGEQPDRRHAQKPVRLVPRGGRSEAFEQKTHKSRRCRACFRLAADSRRRATFPCDPHQTRSLPIMPASPP